MYHGFETIWSARSESELTDLDLLIDAASSGNVAAVNAYIKRNIHQQDKNGEALYQALKHGHTDCVIALKYAIDKKSSFQILSRHYYAAGLAGKYLSFELYTRLIPDIPATVRKEPPLFIKNGNVNELKKNMTTGAYQLSDWLFYSITEQHFTSMLLLLKAGATILPKHFYAAGKLSEKSPTASNDFYQLLFAVQTGLVKRDRAELELPDHDAHKNHTCTQQ
jgi:hypothetical protein